MNRCHSHHTHTPPSAPRAGLRPRPLLAFFLSSALLCLGSATAPGQALAQEAAVRPFPPTAVVGAMQITNPPELLMNGQPARLSPGARIRGANNMLVMSGALVGQQLLVNFVCEPQGLIHEVWILNETEARLITR